RQLVGYATSTDGITWTKWPTNPIIDTDPVWGYCYYGGTVLKFNDKYHLWYACFHSPPTQARPQIGYAVSSINNIYPENVFIDKYYAKKNIDSILFTTRLSNAGNHQFTAHLICFNSDSTQIDSLALFDDGFHGDSLSNDGLFGVYIPPRTIEDYFTLSLSIFDHQNNEYYLTPDLSRFTTAGPVVVDSIYVTYNSFVKAYYVKLFLKNEGNTFTIPYSTVQLSSDDLWITSISPSQSLPEILPGVIVSSGNFYVRVDSTFPGQFNFNFLVSVDGWPYWSDSAKVIVTGIEDEKQVPLTFRLEQNFPNPFNSFSVIKYSIPNSSKVIIKVFDVLGTEIETLINEEKPLGTYELNWNAANLPSGVYFYRLQAGDFVQTRKMILLK
ncbi:MAG: T9SS type A sorting domain-containing protein, partial [Ignavibacteriaceae bacterium]|nr:T9SS type A sorting domain-containing protein [Ignavibacteriaceae bacterium]